MTPIQSLEDQSTPSLKAIIFKTVLATVVVAAFACVVFWGPLVNRSGAIQWDAVNVHFYNLQFSSAMLRSGNLPLWTPYLFGGFPQIADLQVALFYPVNFAISLFSVFTPDLLMYQLVFHYVLAGVFSFWFVQYLSQDFWFSLAAGLCYAFGGFMIGNASHIGMQNTGAWLPIITLLLFLAIDHHRAIYGVLCGFCYGIAILAGHFQVSLYIGYLVVFYSVFHVLWLWEARHDRDELITSARNCLRQLSLIVITAFLISAIQLIPTYELVQQSVRQNITLETSQLQSLEPQSLLGGLLVPNYNDVSFGDYQGPWDRTQNYFYLSITVPVLAVLGTVLGIRSLRTRRITIFWTVFLLVSLFYGFGKFSFVQPIFYDLVPFFNKVSSPTNMMLMVNLAIIGLASASISEVRHLLAARSAKAKAEPNQNWRLKAAQVFFSGRLGLIGFVSFMIISIDLLNATLPNELLYARHSPDSIIQANDMTQSYLEEYAGLATTDRFRVWRRLDSNSSQIFGVLDFDGYNPLELVRHAYFSSAMLQHTDLIDLAGIKYLPCEDYAGCVDEHYFPRVFFVDKYEVASPANALDALSNTNLRTTVVLEDPIVPALPSTIPELGMANSISVGETRPGFWEFDIQSSRLAFLVLTETYYPGWSVSIDGQDARIYRADYLFQGVFVPLGNHKVIFAFDSMPFNVGAVLTIIGLVFVLTMIVWSGKTGILQVWI